jgi:CRP-like cAMP-binding protein
LEFRQQAFEDLQYWVQTNPKLAKRLLRLMEERGRLFLFPSGSLVTPITQRVSGSLYVLGRRSGALIIPWFTTYRGFPRSEEGLSYRPLALIVRRLLGPQATILCQEGTPIDPSDFPDQAALSDHIRELYARRKMSMESIT